MRLLKVLVFVLFAAALALPLCMSRAVEGQGATEALTTDMDAKTDDLFNNFGVKGNPINDCVAEAEAPPNGRGTGRFEDNKFIFSERETVEEGLGPTYNDVGCVECHQATDVGGFSQSMELRAGHLNSSGNFVDAPGGSLVNVRGTDAKIVERISTAEDVNTFRVSLPTLGDGFIECLSNTVLQNNVAAQPAAQRGSLTAVPVTEANGVLRIGRFGWKAQHASLQSFSGDAYFNEMGITNPFDGNGGQQDSPATTANGLVNFNGPPNDPFDPVADPEDDGGDVIAFADFMAATRAPRPLPATAQTNTGSARFNSVGCAVCHTRTFTTATTGTQINGGAFQVPAALASKIIHPFSDFALHNVGTGDGIVQNGGQGSANQIRTPPLWGIRARNRLMHDGLTFTITDAINRHAGQATSARNAFNSLSAADRAALVAFVLSL